MAAAVVHASNATLTQVGIGTVLTRPLPDQIHDAPAAIPLLNVFEGECRHLGAPEPATEKHGKDGPVAQIPCWWWHPVRTGAPVPDAL
jgi:hypothetical protein